MGKVFIIARKDMKDAFQNKTTFLFVILLCILAAPYFGSFSSTIYRLLRQGVSQTELQLASQSFLDSAIYILPLVLTMLICGVFSAYSIIMDKSKRTLESLLATPVSLRQIWLGKSLAVTLPSVIIAILVSLLTILAMNLAIVKPLFGSFIVPSPISFVIGLVIVPVIVFLVVSLVTFLQLIWANPRIANFIFTVVFFGVYFTTITGATSSWNLTLIFIIVVILLAALTVFIARFLTKDRVVLSSKG
ncbi:MAG: hypothetical protein FJ025_02760 [Chloroflexi bacterium]|nr:hypothetical protein [Chloroflexota bacterium]